ALCTAMDTPNIDRVAAEGALFTNAFVPAPSCTPCRSSILSGRYFYQTGRGAILQGAVWDAAIPTYPLLLERHGYHIGYSYKVWSPGTPANAGYGGQRTRYQSAGSRFGAFSQNTSRRVEQGVSVAEAKESLLAEARANFRSFLDDRDAGQPFCYWFGPTNTHRKWVAGSGAALWDVEPDDLAGKLPPFLPDAPTVRQDVADYLGEAMAFDAGLGALLNELDAVGEADNTLVVVSGDHGAPGFPQGKCNLYDFGVHVALAVRWPSAMSDGRILDDFVNLMDLAPTFLEAAGVPQPNEMAARSLLPTLKSDAQGQVDPSRSWVVTGRERHVAKARDGDLPYPQRALRTKDYLYIVNFEPERWPMGAPRTVTPDDAPKFNQLANDTFIAFGDFDASPTKAWIVGRRDDPDQIRFFELAFGKRPREELYDLKTDRWQVVNVAQDVRYAGVRRRMNQQLLAELKRTGDPRVVGDGMTYERPPYAP
ncbi:MAG: sulfatase, partial [Planctomycetota bacterium]